MSDAQPKSCACKSAVFRLFQKNGAGREFEIDSPAFDTDDFGVPMDNLTATDVWKLCLEWMSVVPATNDDTPRKEAFQLFLRNGTSTGLTPMPIHGSDLALRLMLRKNLASSSMPARRSLSHW